VDPAVKLAQVPRRPPLSDLVAAGALAAWALVEAFVANGPGAPGAHVAFALAISVPLVFRRRAPFAVVCVIAGATLIRALTADVASTGTMPFPCLLFATFSVALYAKRELEAIGGGLIVAASMAVALNSPFYEGNPGPGDIAIFVFFLGGTWTAGWLVRRRAAQARLALAESGELARSAVAEERGRIARELHDVVAHSVSIIAVQAGAAEELLERDPNAAREHLGAVRRTAREAMGEMRRLLDVLREKDASYAPQPGLSRLPDLLDEVRGAGVPVELVEDGEPRELPAGLDLVAFRVVQEALTNVRKHAGGAATRVALRYGEATLELEIVNSPGHAARPQNGAAGGGGHGLIGMRERVLLFGGRFEAAENGDGGFRVHAVLPLEEEPA
jgi:signal transduction histidine kinase